MVTVDCLITNYNMLFRRAFVAQSLFAEKAAVVLREFVTVGKPI